METSPESQLQELENMSFNVSNRAICVIFPIFTRIKQF